MNVVVELLRKKGLMDGTNDKAQTNILYTLVQQLSQQNLKDKKKTPGDDLPGVKTVLTALERCCALQADVKASDLQKYFDTVKQGEAKIWKEFLGSKANPGAAALVKAVTSRVKTCVEDEKHSRTVRELREILDKKPEIPVTDIGRWSEVFGKASTLRKTTSQLERGSRWHDRPQQKLWHPPPQSVNAGVNTDKMDKGRI